MWPWIEVGLIRAWQMNSHAFSTFCDDLDCEHGSLLLILTGVSYQKYLSIFSEVFRKANHFPEVLFKLSYEDFIKTSYESETPLNRLPTFLVFFVV